MILIFFAIHIMDNDHSYAYSYEIQNCDSNFIYPWWLFSIEATDET